MSDDPLFVWQVFRVKGLTLTDKVKRGIIYFEIPDPKNLQNKKKIIALATLEQEIRKVTLMSRDLDVQGHA